jgi:hypothetical protein
MQTMPFYWLFAGVRKARTDDAALAKKGSGTCR